MIHYHSPCSEVWTLFVLLAVAENALESPNAVRYQIMRLEKVEILGDRVSGKSFRFIKEVPFTSW